MLTLEQIEPYLRVKVPKEAYHRYYDKSVKIAVDIDAVFGANYPKYLSVNRPKETKEVKAYRKNIYDNLWVGFPERILQKIDKIQQSDDFVINYPVDPKTDKIDTLKYYCENKIGVSKTLQDWFFQTFLRTYLYDPNAVLVVFPKLAGNEKEYANPLPILINCNRVIGYKEGKFGAFLSEERTVIYNERGEPIRGKTGNIWVFFDGESYTIARQTRLYPDNEGNWIASYDIMGIDNYEDGISVFNPPLHYCDGMPAFKVGQLIEETSEDGESLFKSILSAALPFIRQAQSRYCDLQIEFNHHVNSLEWLYDFFRCTNPDCDGGIINNGKNQTCDTCGGTGRRPLSSAETLIVSKVEGAMGEGGGYPPVPPGGVIPRSIEPATKLIEYIDKLNEQAWRAIDMSDKGTFGVSESGRAKELDKEIENTKIRSIGMYLIRVAMRQTFENIARQRYSLYFGKEYIDGMLPDITVPFNLNLLDSSYVQEELKAAKENGMSPVLLSKLSKIYIEKSFGKTSDEMKLENAIETHDRLYGYSINDKIMVFGGGKNSPTMAIKYEDYIISLNVYGFIRRAIEESPNFIELDYAAQREILNGYATEVISANPEPQLYNSNPLNNFGNGGGIG